MASVRNSLSDAEISGRLKSIESIGRLEWGEVVMVNLVEDSTTLAVDESDQKSGFGLACHLDHRLLGDIRHSKRIQAQY